ncbi:MAG: LysR family transcriptional regulator, partial [Achromobacter veterisilvae]
MRRRQPCRLEGGAGRASGGQARGRPCGSPRTMNRFHEMTVFLAVAEAQSFAAAARRLEMSAPTVTRSVAALERRLGALL